MPVTSSQPEVVPGSCISVRQRLRPSRPAVNTTLRVLLVIAIVLSAVQVSALVVALVQSDEDTTNALSGFAAEAVLRWRVYSIGALASLVAGFLVRRRQRLAGDAL